MLAYLPSFTHFSIFKNIQLWFEPAHIKNLRLKYKKTVILPVVLYGYETWSLTLREEHRLRVFENRVLRRIFGPKREEDGSWRKFHNDELLNLRLNQGG
jgi:hypothetical protein